jgi:inorganic phosphate transporter, PiT family
MARRWRAVIASVVIAGGLIKQFSGRGLVEDALAASAAFSFAVAGGADLTVMLATRLGFPISTTHALFGGLLGAGLVSGSAISWNAIGSGFMLPLLISPILSLAACFVFYNSILLAQKRYSSMPVASDTAGEGALLLEASDDSETPTLRAAHIGSAIAICFVRAVNGTPKLAALMLGVGMLSSTNSALATTAMMVIGGWILSRRVAETMSMKISEISAVQGVTANIITAFIVLSASRFGLPVSTTHVSVGSIIGGGAAAGRLDLSTVRAVLLSWVITLPLAAALAGLTGLFVFP